MPKKKKPSLFGKLKAKAKRVKALFHKKKDDAGRCKPERENVAPSRDVERTDTVGDCIVDVSRQFG